MDYSTALTLGGIFALIATILTCIFIWPQSRVPSMNKFMYTLHCIVNFKTLLIEKIIKFFYILSTCSCILCGFFMLFVSVFGRSLALTGLIMMILGPIVIRFFYEFLMMAIILVEGVTALRRKFCDEDQGAPAAQRPAAPAAPKIAPNYVFCTKCGTRYDANAGGCPNGCDNN